MISFDRLIDELFYATLLEDRLLVVLLTEYMVELETLRLVVKIDTNLFRLVVGKQSVVGIAVAPLAFKKGSDTHGYFNTRGHPQ